MTISLSLDVSHRRPHIRDVLMKFKVTVVPERVVPTNDMHYMILVDVSGSMEGTKLEMARRGLEGLLSKIPEGNRVTLMTFSDKVNIVSDFQSPKNVDLKLSAGGGTELYKALQEAYSRFAIRRKPGYLVLLTDGRPTDVHEPEAYSQLEVPSYLTLFAFGVGEDYNEAVLKASVDSCGGKLYHMEDPETVARELPKAAVTYVAAKDLSLDFRWPREVKPLNYRGPPIRLGGVQEAVKIYGQTVIPGGSRDQLKVVATYKDPVDDSVRVEEEVLGIEEGDFLSGINRDLIKEYAYYELLDKYGGQIMEGKIEQATKTLECMDQIAQDTGRVELMSATRRLRGALESTRRLEGTQRTSRLSKEVASEVTRAMR